MPSNIEATAIVRRNGRVTLPIELRRELGIAGGAKVTFTANGKTLFLDFENPDAGLASNPIQRLTMCIVD